jgi:hypothetical protein
MASLTEVVGWRVFAVGDNGELLPPFTNRYWPESGQSTAAWGGLGARAYWLTLAHCSAGGDHAAPAEGCTCGLRATVDLSELLAAVTQRQFTGSTSSILDECGVIARVRLTGKILPGVGMPEDDPYTTWRGSQAEVLDLHVAPGMERHRGPLATRYGVCVAKYDPDQWLHAVADLPAPTGPPVSLPAPIIRRDPTPDQKTAFCAAIRPLGFGTKSTAQPEQFLLLATDLVATMRGGVTPTDAGRALFDCNAHPTWAQVKGFVRAAIEHLAPDLRDQPDGAVLAPGVTVIETMNRAVLDAVGLNR